MATVRATAQPAPIAGRAPYDGYDDGWSKGSNELRELLKDYKGFGILSLIGALVGRDCRSSMLALVGLVLLVGQWLGPVGFVAFKLGNEDISECAGDGGRWAKLLMASVATIYFARLSVAALAHRQERPQEFDAYQMPKWWRVIRSADLIVTSLLYDTFIFLANLLIVFQDRDVNDMVVDVLALEFFTLIDDEFKSAVIEYDSSFLDCMMVTPQPSEIPCPLRQSGHASEPHSVEDRTTCGETLGEVVLSVVELTLLIVRAACRIAGPLGAFVMIFYGPHCLGAPVV